MDIYSYITQEENAFMFPVAIEDQYDWSMKDHIATTVLYKNSQLKTGKSDDKPVKNIIRPILNLQYRAEGFDVKDIELFINHSDFYYKSLLVKKFHDKWARENHIDTFIDDLVETYVDFGGVLVKDVNDVKPEVVPWQSIAFCDQTDVLSGPIAIRHFYSPDQLMAMADKGWGNPKNGATISLENLILMGENTKTPDKQIGVKTKTPGKYIEVYEVHGTMPESFLEENGSEAKYLSQIQIVAFYKDQNDQKQGVTLFSAKEKDSPFKLLLRDKIYGRALGFGGAEELFEAQVWTTYSLIKQKGLLDATSKIIYKTTDAAYATRNKTSDLENGEVLVLEEGKDINQINTQAVNIPLFERFIGEWESHAQQMGSANDAIMGKSPTSGTPFKLQELVTEESRSLHEYRKGKIATFVGEIYDDWILPYLSKEITNGSKFIAELSLEELQFVASGLADNEVNNMVKEKILDGQIIQPNEVASFKEKVRGDFMKGGNKRFIEILKGEMKSIPMNVRISIVGKQKNLGTMTDKLTNIFRQIIAAPQSLENPILAKLFNQIMISSGLEPLDLSLSKSPESAMASKVSPVVPESLQSNLV